MQPMYLQPQIHGLHVSTPIESSSGPDDDSIGVETCSPCIYGYRYNNGLLCQTVTFSTLILLFLTLRGGKYKVQQVRQCTCNVILGCFRATIIVVEEQWVLHNMSACICSVRYPASKYQGKNRSTENSKGNKTVPEKVATTRIEDGHKQNTKTSTTIQTKTTMEHGTNEEQMEGPTSS